MVINATFNKNQTVPCDTGRQRTSITIEYHLNGQLVSSLLIFQCPMSHGTMKYTLKAHICYFVLMDGLLHYLYSLHAGFYTSENIIKINT
jgi:hypothetical protein